MLKDNSDFLEGLNGHEVEAFHILYQRYYKPLVLFAVGYLDDEVEAEDVVQDVIVKLWEGNMQFDSLQHFKVYIYNAVHNKAVSLLRHKNVVNSYVDSEMKTSSEEDSEYDYEYEEMEVKFLEAVDLLPEKTREVILCYMEGKSLSEIAEHLGITKGTVKTHRQRAFEKLRQISNCMVLWLAFEHFSH